MKGELEMFRRGFLKLWKKVFSKEPILYWEHHTCEPKCEASRDSRKLAFFQK